MPLAPTRAGDGEPIICSIPVLPSLASSSSAASHNADVAACDRRLSFNVLMLPFTAGPFTPFAFAWGCLRLRVVGAAAAAAAGSMRARRRWMSADCCSSAVWSWETRWARSEVDVEAGASAGAKDLRRVRVLSMFCWDVGQRGGDLVG